VLISFGCFFELEPLAETGGSLGGGGTFGAVGGEGGDTPVAGEGGSGAGGDPVFPGCNSVPGTKDCGAGCVPVGPENGCNDPECRPCPSVANAAAPTCGGDGGPCQIASCNSGFADCDGDLSSYGVESGGNGCEYSFGTIAEANQPLSVPRAQILVADGTRDDWSGIPAYRLEHPCVDCQDDGTAFRPSAQNEAPPSSDLSAYVRVAWDANNFYVLAEAFDDFIFSDGSSVDNGSCRTNGDYVPGPMCEDAFAIYFDGRQNGGNYGNEDHRIFIGASGASFAPSQGQPPTGTVVTRLLPSPGPRCYRLEAQFDWKLLVSNQGQPVDGKFPPAANQSYGFDIAVSDWDQSLTDASSFERQSQLFYTQRPAQSELHPSIAGVGVIVLTDHSGSDPQTPQ